MGATGYIVAASGGVLPNIPKLPNGQYDYKTLTDEAQGDQVEPGQRARRRRRPSTRTRTSPTTSSIATLDAMRQAEDGKILFPDVDFAAGIQ